MTQPARVRVDLELELPSDLARLTLPEGVDRRLQSLLDKQDAGQSLTDEERLEAEGLVDLAETLSLLRLRATTFQGGGDAQTGGSHVQPLAVAIRREEITRGRYP